MPTIVFEVPEFKHMGRESQANEDWMVHTSSEITGYKPIIVEGTFTVEPISVETAREKLLKDFKFGKHVISAESEKVKIPEGLSYLEVSPENQRSYVVAGVSIEEYLQERGDSETPDRTDLRGIQGRNRQSLLAAAS